MQQPPNQPPYGSNPNYPQQPYNPNQQQQPNYYPQQQPPMQANYYQQPQPPKKKHTGCVVSAIIAVVVLVAIIAVAASHGGSSPSTATTTTQGNQSQSTSSSTHKIGENVTLDNWVVVVNGIKTSTGGQFNQPQKAGNVFLLIDLSVQNNTGQSQSFSSLIQLSLKDASGQSYTETIDTDAPKTPDGTVANGSKLRGTAVYEVPKSTSSFEFDFSPGLGSTDQAVWSLSV